VCNSWPKPSPIFSRRFGATIIPFAGVGAEDCVNIVQDVSDLLELPVVGQMIKDSR
jgi:hypothetical protein